MQILLLCSAFSLLVIKWNISEDWTLLLWFSGKADFHLWYLRRIQELSRKLGIREKNRVYNCMCESEQYPVDFIGFYGALFFMCLIVELSYYMKQGSMFQEPKRMISIFCSLSICRQFCDNFIAYGSSNCSHMLCISKLGCLFWLVRSRSYSSTWMTLPFAFVRRSHTFDSQGLSCWQVDSNRGHL